VAKPIISRPANAAPTPMPAFAPMVSPEDGEAIVEEFGLVLEAAGIVVPLVDVDCEDEVDVETVDNVNTVEVLLNCPGPLGPSGGGPSGGGGGGPSGPRPVSAQKPLAYALVAA